METRRNIKKQENLLIKLREKQRLVDDKSDAYFDYQERINLLYETIKKNIIESSVILSTTRGFGSKLVNVTVLPNTGRDSRKLSLKFNSLDGKPLNIIRQGSSSFSFEGGTYQIKVICSGRWTIEKIII